MREKADSNWVWFAAAADQAGEIIKKGSGNSS